MLSGRNIAVTSGESLRSDFTLELGAVTESVQVTAQAVALQTDSTRVSTNLSTRLVEDLPLVVTGQVRNVFNLAVIAPEAKNSSTFRIGGGQGSGWDMQMDGASLASGTVIHQFRLRHVRRFSDTAPLIGGWRSPPQPRHRFRNSPPRPRVRMTNRPHSAINLHRFSIMRHRSADTKKDMPAIQP